MKPWKRDYDPDPDEPDDEPGEPSPADEKWLELPGARLEVPGDELLRRNSKGKVILRLKLAEIEEVAARRGFDPMSVFIAAAALGLAAIGCFASESTTLTAILYVVALILLLVAAFGSVRQQLDLVVNGKVIPVYCTDNPDEVAGFAASLKAELDRRRKGTGPV